MVPNLSPAQVWWLVVVFAAWALYGRLDAAESTYNIGPIILYVPAQRAVRVPIDTRRPLRRTRRGEIFRTSGMLFTRLHDEYQVWYLLPEYLCLVPLLTET